MAPLLLAPTGVSLAQGSDGEEQALQVSELRITPEQTTPGVPAHVEFTVSNPSGDTRQTSLALLVEEQPEDERALALPAGASQVLEFWVARSDPGSYTLRVEESAKAFRVVGADLSLAILDIEPRVTTPGGSVRVTALARNGGAIPGAFDTALTLDGRRQDRLSGFLDPGEERLLAFDLPAGTPGSHTVTFGEAGAQFTTAGPLQEVTVPGSFAVNPGTSAAAAEDGGPAPIAGSTVRITAGDEGDSTVTFPVALETGRLLVSFEDQVSGIGLDDGTLNVPLRGPDFEVIGSLTATTGPVRGTGSAASGALAQVTLHMEGTTTGRSGELTGLPVGIQLDVTTAAAPVGGSLAIGARSGTSPQEQAKLASPGDGEEVVPRGPAFQIAFQDFPPAATVQRASASVAVAKTWLEAHGGGERIRLVTVDANGQMQVRTPEVTGPGEDGQVRLTVGTAAMPGQVTLAVVQPAADVNVTGLATHPTHVAAGEPFEVRAQVEPPDGDVGRVRATLLVAGVPSAVAETDVPSGEGGDLRFLVPGKAAGKYRLTVGDLEKTVRIVAAATSEEVRATRLRVDPGEVSSGEQVAVQATVFNFATQDRVVTVPLEVDGFVVSAERVIVPAAGTRELHTTVARNAPGEHTVRLEGVERSFRVAQSLAPASLEVSAMTVTPGIALPGEEVTVRGTASNPGDEPGTFQFEVFIGGERVAEQSLSLGPRMTAPWSVQATARAPGDHAVTAGEATTTLVVVHEGLPTVLKPGDLSFSPEAPRDGDELTVALPIENRGKARHEGIARLQLDGEVLTERELVLEPKGHAEIEMMVGGLRPDLYEVAIVIELRSPAKARARFWKRVLVQEALKPAAVEVVRVEVTPEGPAPGMPFSVEALVANTGQSPATYELAVQVDGTTVESRTIEIPGQRTVTETFELTAGEPGVHSLAVGDVVTSFEVVEVSPSPEPSPPGEGEETPTMAAPEPERQPAEGGGIPPGLLVFTAGAVALAAAAAALLWRRRRRAVSGSRPPPG